MLLLMARGVGDDDVEDDNPLRGIQELAHCGCKVKGTVESVEGLVCAKLTGVGRKGGPTAFYWSLRQVPQ